MTRVRMLRTVANSPAGSERTVSESIARHLINAGAAEEIVSAAPLDMSPTAIRAWAIANGIEVSSKGFIKKAVTEAYINAHN